MRIIYLIPAYNEEASLDKLVADFSAQLGRFTQLQVYIIDNASTDGTKQVTKSLETSAPWVHGIFIKEKGMGIAFRHAMRELIGLQLSSDDWIIFSAADLPFGFSDLDSFLQIKNTYGDCPAFVGSKSHPNSKLKRTLKRTLASWIFFVLRWALLSMRTKDPHGTIFLRADYLHLVDRIASKDYFFSTELVYYVEQISKVIEMPIVLRPEIRPSKVNLFVDGFKIMKQIIQLKLRQVNTR